MLGTTSAVTGSRPLRQRDFGLFWLGSSVNKLGTAVNGVVTPLFAVTALHADAFQVGLLTAATWLPWLLVGLPAGAWVDRLPRRPILLATSTLSTVFMLGLWTAARTGTATFALLLFVGLAVGVAGVFANTAGVVFLPSLVGPDRLTGANARLQASEAVALVAGPSLGGVLTGLFSPSLGLFLDAVSFAFSAVCLVQIRAEETTAPRGGRTRLAHDVADGMRLVWRDPLLRVMTANAAVANLAMTGTEGLAIVFLDRALHVSSTWVGALVASWGIGAAVGALVATRVAARIGSARTLLVATLAGSPFGFLVPLSTGGSGLVLFVVGALVPFVGVAMYNVVAGSFRQHYCAPGTLGRVTATMKCFLYGAAPVGAVMGGAMAVALGVRGALWVCMALNVVAAGLFLLSPVRRMRDLPVHRDRAPSDSVVVPAGHVA